MALSDITQKILNDANKQADTELKNAQASVKKIEEKTKSLKKEQLSEQEQQLIVKKEASTRERVALYRQKVKAFIDKKKRKLLNETFDKALQQMQDMSEKEQETYVKKALASISQDLSGAHVLVAKGTSKSMQKILQTIGSGKLEVEESDTLSSGFILQAEAYEYDFTFESVLANKKKEIETQAANALFAK